MEDLEYFDRIKAAYLKMDDRARKQQLRQFERAAEEWPREDEPPKGLRLVTGTLAPVVPLKRVG